MIANFTDIRVLIRGAGEMAGGIAHRSGIQIGASVKVGDVDPGFETEYRNTISGTARAIGGGVVEAIFTHPRG